MRTPLKERRMKCEPCLVKAKETWRLLAHHLATAVDATTFIHYYSSHFFLISNFSDMMHSETKNVLREEGNNKVYLLKIYMWIGVFWKVLMQLKNKYPVTKIKYEIRIVVLLEEENLRKEIRDNICSKNVASLPCQHWPSLNILFCNMLLSECAWICKLNHLISIWKCNE